jgi:hypothetical protein
MIKGVNCSVLETVNKNKNVMYRTLARATYNALQTHSQSFSFYGRIKLVSANVFCSKIFSARMKERVICWEYSGKKWVTFLFESERSSTSKSPTGGVDF